MRRAIARARHSRKASFGPRCRTRCRRTCDSRFANRQSSRTPCFLVQCAPSVVGPHEREASRVAIGQRPEHHGVHDAEHHGVDADSQREREQNDDGESRIPSQAARRVANVAQHCLDGRIPSARAHVSFVVSTPPTSIRAARSAAWRESRRACALASPTPRTARPRHRARARLPPFGTSVRSPLVIVRRRDIVPPCLLMPRAAARSRSCGAPIRASRL